MAEVTVGDTNAVRAVLARWAAHPDQFVREAFAVTPDAWQDELLRDFPRCPQIAMSACKGPGKAQPVDTPIPTPNGVRRFGDLKVGDFVFAADGSPTVIRAVYDRGEREVYRFVFDDGSDTLACAEHLWKVRGRTERRHNTWAVLNTKQIIERGVREKNGRWAGRHFEIPRQGALQLPTAELPLDPYVLGVWLGDGVRKTSRYATKPMPEIQHRITSLGFKTQLSEVYRLVTVYGIAALLRELNVLSLYSRQRYVPEPYKWADIEQRKALLMGLMDTDGGIDVDGHTEFSSTSEQLAHDVVWLVRSLGGVAFLKATVKQPFYYAEDGAKVLGYPCYRVTLRTPFNPFYVEHKRSRWRDPMASASTLRYMTRKLDAIEPAGRAHCVCIAVEHPEHLYLTEDFIVTHNTAELSWLAWNFILTRVDAKIPVLSITGSTLADTLWSEMALWYGKSLYLQHFFHMSTERITSKERPKTWWMSARSFPRNANPQQQADTLAGIHGPHVMVLLDEANGMPRSVLATVQAVRSEGLIDQRILIAGNPTNQDSALGQAVINDRANWRVMEITGDPDDPKRSPRVNVEYARAQINQWGRDNPWVLCNIFGKFPPGGINTLISAQEVMDAQKRHYKELDFAGYPYILGVDVARFGDDETVFFPRRGKICYPPMRMRNLDNVFVASHLSRISNEKGADSVQIDVSGAGGVYDVYKSGLRQTNALPVQFGGKASQESRYANKRAEIWCTMADGIKQDGWLLPSADSAGNKLDQMVHGMSSVTYTFDRQGRILLEDKQQLKDRIGRSPDLEDALACTCAYPVAVKPKTISGLPSSMVEAAMHVHDYDPYEKYAREVEKQYG